MNKATLELMVDDMSKSVSFYTDLLGFEKKIVFPETNPVFVRLNKDDVEIMLYMREEFVKEIPKFKDMKLGGSVALFISINDIQSLYDFIKEKVTLIQELHTTNYGTTEFSLEDPNGYVLMFSQTN